MPQKFGRAPHDVVIRTATSHDIPQFRSFTCVNAHEPWTVAPELLVQMEVPVWVGRSDAVVLVAERVGLVVGVIAMTPQPDRPDVYLSQVLAVAHDHRRQRIGYSLKLAAMTIAHDLGAELITSEVDGRNVAMLGCNDLFNAVREPEPDDPTTLINAVRVVE